ncbi:DNA repair protein RecO [Micromonospora terminaliae]|uniref:DNA repair protein RecO n=1 Tax=Micromonospora terminaliae TaxID=1914461 RepID=A0AAJ2ZGC1_9ACTN|nr:DNA repair protein RecO [Micromonospora terminaliae]NES29111.1 DNA repair protein RecO [Micromonospora terminaliae]QGL48885.1 DNA repair protein RecO [Micromonospora terminaliae]
MAGYRRQLYRDDAVVLRVQKLGESDRIITLLTRRHGRLRAVARGVRRTTSKFGARLEPFGHVDLQLAGDPKGNHGSSLHTISQAEGIDLYGKRFLGDYPRYTAASAIAETAERLTPIEREPSLRLFQLTLGALRSLATGEHATTLVLDAYLLRGMAFAGWAPALTACAVCGTPGRHRAFSVPAGGAVCPDCRPPGAAHPAPASVELMSALTTGDWAYADATETAVRRECSGLVAAHLQWHLERALRSLPLVDRGAPAPGAVPPPGGAGPGVVPPRTGAGPAAAGVNREITE